MSQMHFTETQVGQLVARAVAEERERCARIASNGCLVPPDGGSPTEDEVQMCNDIAAAIRNPDVR